MANFTERDIAIIGTGEAIVIFFKYHLALDDPSQLHHCGPYFIHQSGLGSPHSKLIWRPDDKS